MRLKCEYCGTKYKDIESNCPNCGAVNRHVYNDNIPQTIEELQSYCNVSNIPLDRLRFYIGINYTEPRAFGIYKDDYTGEFVVYKNKANGQRVERYRGYDEAYAVNEIYQKLKQESSSYRSYRKGLGNKSNSKAGNIIRIIFFVYIFSFILQLAFSVFLALFVVVSSGLDSGGTRAGYYKYNDEVYYNLDDTWYIYEGDDWYEINPDNLDEDFYNYYEENFDYKDEGISSFEDTDYYQDWHDDYYSDDYYSDDWDDDWDDNDSWSDDDWDYDDGWDSDWDSDW